MLVYVMLSMILYFFQIFMNFNKQKYNFKICEK